MIPKARDITSSEMRHRPADLFNPPALTNFLGCVQADVDPIAIRNLNFPPFATSNVVTATLFLDGRIFAALGEPVTFRWRPDRIEREARARDLSVRSTTILVPGDNAVVVAFEVRNEGGMARTVRMRLGLRGSVVKQETAWLGPLPPSDLSNEISFDAARKALVFTSKSGAVAVQGVAGSLEAALDPGGISLETGDLAPGESVTGAYVQAIAGDPDGALALYDRIASDPSAEIARAEEEWDSELEAAFTPGNDRYSGSMPVLVSNDPDLQRLYHIGLLGVVYFKRETPHSVIGRTYDTLMPRYWQTTTFLWDYSLSSLVHSLLDPQVMRAHLERWMSMDVHSLFASEWLTGGPMGRWYSVNDHAMCWMMHRYLSWSGDTDWLDKTVPSADGEGKKVIDFLQDYARAYRSFDRGSGLADYGGIDNLLECVSSYVHEVASLNAANVWNLRAAGEILEAVSGSSKANDLRREAEDVMKLLGDLYAEGRGWWYARDAEKNLAEVRHCYDFLMIADLLPDELSEEQKKEMAGFFDAELKTPVWMRALSPEDPDAAYSVRPDHQWNGAYTAWPARAASGLFRIGRADLAAEWIRGLARSANQGPFGQAHFVETYAAPEDGGALKASAEFPYINDWACSSGGAWAELVISSLFGVRADAAGGLTAEPQIASLDPSAVLEGLVHRGRTYVVDSSGIRE